MFYNVVKIMCPELGCLKTNFDGVQHLFGQIPLHISSSGTSISINGESHSRIIMFDVKPLADESVALRRLFVLEGNISMDGVRSEPTHPSKALSAQFDDAGNVVSIEFGNIEPIVCGRQPKVDIVSSHGFHASFDDSSHKCDRVLMAPIKWNRGDPTVVGKDRKGNRLRIWPRASLDDLFTQRYFEFLPSIPLIRVVAIKNESVMMGFTETRANDGFMRMVTTSGAETEDVQRDARPPPSCAFEELRKQLHSDERSLRNMSEGLRWLENNPLKFPKGEREIDERFARSALMWVDRLATQFNPITHAWVASKKTSAPSLGAAAFNRLTTASSVLDALTPEYMAFKEQNECNCSPLSSKCGNPFCSFKSSRAVLIPFTPPPNATTIAQLDTMRREIADRMAQDEKRATDEVKRMNAFYRRLTAFIKMHPELSRMDASEALRLQEAEAASAKSTARPKSAAAAAAAAAAKSTAATASADDAPGGFAMTKSGPKSTKKKGGSKTCKRKHRK